MRDKEKSEKKQPQAINNISIVFFYRYKLRSILKRERIKKKKKILEEKRDIGRQTNTHTIRTLCIFHHKHQH